MKLIYLPFIECPERTEFSDECYGALGRALYISQQFEAKCRSLAMLLTTKRVHAIGEAGSLDDPNFFDFVNDLWKRQLSTNIKVLRNYGLPNKAGSVLHKAREARNQIAHNVTLGIEHKIEKNKGRKEILGNIVQCTRAVAEGDRLVGVLIQIVNHEPWPTPEYLRKYPDEVIKWVCETFI